MKRLAPAELDAIGVRLEQIELEEAALRSQLVEQVQEFGFTPPRAEKLKRLLDAEFEFTLSSSQSTEIRDAEGERIREVCPSRIFTQLFVAVTKYNLAGGATALLLASFPRPRHATFE